MIDSGVMGDGSTIIGDTKYSLEEIGGYWKVSPSPPVLGSSKRITIDYLLSVECGINIFLLPVQ